MDPVNSLNNGHTFGGSAFWLCHISWISALFFPNLMNTNNKIHCGLINSTAIFRNKYTIFVTSIGCILLNSRAVIEYILKTFMPPLAPPKWICINIALLVAPLFLWFFILMHTFVPPIFSPWTYGPISISMYHLYACKLPKWSQTWLLYDNSSTHRYTWIY